MSLFESIFQSVLSRASIWIKIRSSIWFKVLEILPSREFILIKIMESFSSHESIWIEILEGHLSRKSIWIIKYQKKKHSESWVDLNKFLKAIVSHELNRN